MRIGFTEILGILVIYYIIRHWKRWVRIIQTIRQIRHAFKEGLTQDPTQHTVRDVTPPKKTTDNKMES